MTRYEQGFLAKCAEYGADPELVSNYVMKKQAWGSGPNGIGARIGDARIGIGTRGKGDFMAGVTSPSGGFGIGLNRNVIGNSLLGAGAGALAGLTYENLLGDDRKDYLRRALRTALYGALVSGAATMITGAPNYLPHVKKRIRKAFS